MKPLRFYKPLGLIGFCEIPKILAKLLGYYRVLQNPRFSKVLQTSKVFPSFCESPGVFKGFTEP